MLQVPCPVDERRGPNQPESAEGRIRQVRDYLALAALLTIFTSSVTS